MYNSRVDHRNLRWLHRLPATCSHTSWMRLGSRLAPSHRPCRPRRITGTRRTTGTRLKSNANTATVARLPSKPTPLTSIMLQPMAINHTQPTSTRVITKPIVEQVPGAASELIIRSRHKIAVTLTKKTSFLRFTQIQAQSYATSNKWPSASIRKQGLWEVISNQWILWVVLIFSSGSRKKIMLT